jgi:pyruvate dehydrogenase E2 component (dihydrolipoamide acetyltransferase)
MATEVLVPPLGQTVDTVTLVAWHKEEGEAVTEGETLFSIETDKATLEIESPASGMLRRVTAEAGDEVQVLSAIALIAAPDEVLDETLAPGGTVRARPAPAAAAEAATHRTGGRQEGARQRVFVSPRARRLIEQQGIALEALQATGPEGAIVERDVRAYLDTARAPAISPVARRAAEAAGLDWRALAGSGPGGRIVREDVERALAAVQAVEAGVEALGERDVIETIPVRGVRAVIAKRLLDSVMSTAHVTLNAEADASALVELRRRLVEDGYAVSYNDLVLTILAKTLGEHPRLNASLVGDEIKVWGRIDIGLAVDTERGLLVPVVRDAGGKSLLQIADETRALVERARAGQCTPEELRGGTFTLTNLGMYGIDSFTPIINLPECAILGMGRIKRQPVMVGDEMVGRETVWLSLTFDHRLVDGGPAARFLQRLVQLVERPHQLMV